jgi:hypothetical protein
MVTGIATAPPALPALTLIDPLYVPGVRLPGATETVSVSGVTPLVGATESQLPPEPVEAATVIGTVARSEVEIVTLCDGGWLPPVWKMKFNEPGLDASDLAGVTVSVTRTDN